MASGPLTCLIVDDSRVVRKILRRILDNSGFTCSEAENGQEAHLQCEEEMPDLILLDWNMPVMNGLEFLTRLRSLKKGKAAKVIMCTVQNDASAITQALTAGADEYIMKPFDTDILHGKLIETGFLNETV